MINIQQRLARILDINSILCPIVLLKGLEPLAREVGGWVEMVADFRDVEILGLVLVSVPGHYDSILK